LWRYVLNELTFAVRSGIAAARALTTPVMALPVHSLEVWARTLMQGTVYDTCRHKIQLVQITQDEADKTCSRDALLRDAHARWDAMDYELEKQIVGRIESWETKRDLIDETLGDG
jgi:hypothetical protein